ncbi:cytochrome b [Sulfitobacter sp. F26169L]|uniref:cytochrome b n=1 Tax=Sulfitobacter sp. F26169L TaxID=2996015 RepID=UPI002260F2BF|nr:cytochrome b [Sulfitobacter sp. F26169L]MCX7567484.1 cytochrome b [Sulfitobacter sp. F26169L]
MADQKTESEMSTLSDTPARYGPISKWLHWGMALLFAAQFVSAALRWWLPRDHAVRDFFWSYHTDLGVALLLLVLLRGAWGLMNIKNRPSVHDGLIGRLATVGHLAIYALMVVVPLIRVIAAAGSDRGLSFFGLRIFPAQQPEITWLTSFSEWHGELGWILALLIVGHITMAVGWHHLIKRDGSLQRMTR